MSGRRSVPRVPLLTQVEERRENFTTLGWTRDISLGGLSISSQQTLPQGTTVVVRFGLPGRTRAIEAAGQVAWVVPGNSMGVSFLGLLEEDRQNIADYVATLPELPAEEAAGRVVNLTSPGSIVLMHEESAVPVLRAVGLSQRHHSVEH